MIRIRWTRRRKWFAIALPSLVVLYALLGFLGVPAVVQHVVLPSVSDGTLNGEATAESVAFNPFTLTLQVTGLRVADDADQTVASLDQLRANLRIATLWRRGYVFDEVHLGRPFAAMALAEDGTLNLAALLKPRDEPREPTGMPAVTIGTLELADGRFAWADRTTRPAFEHEVESVSFRVNDFRTADEHANTIAFSARTPAGEAITFDGELVFNPLRSTGTFTIQTIDTARYGPYYRRLSDLAISQGRLGMTFTYRFAPLAEPAVMRLEAQRIAVDDLRIARLDADQPFYTLDQGEVNDVAIDLIERQLTIRSVTAKEGQIVGRRTPVGTLEILDTLFPERLRKTNASNEAVARETPPAQPTGNGLVDALQQIITDARGTWRVHVETVALAEHAATWRDESLAEPAVLAIGELTLDAGPLDSANDYAMPFTVAGRVVDGGPVDIQGTARLGEPGVDATMAIDDLPLVALSPYVAMFADASLESGRADVTGKLTAALPPDRALDARFTGSVNFDDLALQASDSTVRGRVTGIAVDELDVAALPLTAAFGQLTLQGISLDGAEDAESLMTIDTVTAGSMRFDADARTMGIQRMAVDKPRFVLTIDQQGQTNVAPMLALFGGNAGHAEPEPDAEPFNIDVAAFDVTEGSGRFVDNALQPAIAVDIDGVRSRVTDFTLREGGRTAFELTARLNSDATFDLNGQTEPGDPLRFTDLTVAGKRFSARRYEALVHRYLGYTVTSGQADFTVPIKLTEGRLDARGEFRMTNLHLGQPVPSDLAVDAPVKLAMDLLRDRDDRIFLDIPITGRVTDPAFDTSQAVGRAIGNVIGSIVTAPFDLLAGTVGGLLGAGARDVDLSYVSFKPGSATLDGDEARKVDALAQALYKKPALGLSISSRPVPSVDEMPLRRRALAESITESRRQAGMPALNLEPAALHADNSDYRTVIASRYLRLPAARKTELPTEPTFAQQESAVLAEVSLPEDALVRLAAARIETVRQRLLDAADLEDERLRTIDPTSTPADQPRVNFEVLRTD